MAWSMATDHSTQASTQSSVAWVRAETSRARAAMASGSSGWARATGPVRIRLPLPEPSGLARAAAAAASARGPLEASTRDVCTPDVGRAAGEPGPEAGLDGGERSRRRRSPAGRGRPGPSGCRRSTRRGPSRRRRRPPSRRRRRRAPADRTRSPRPGRRRTAEASTAPAARSARTGAGTAVSASVEVVSGHGAPAGSSGSGWTRCPGECRPDRRGVRTGRRPSPPHIMARGCDSEVVAVSDGARHIAENALGAVPRGARHHPTGGRGRCRGGQGRIEPGTT